MIFPPPLTVFKENEPVVFQISPFIYDINQTWGIAISSIAHGITGNKIVALYCNLIDTTYNNQSQMLCYISRNNLKRNKEYHIIDCTHDPEVILTLKGLQRAQLGIFLEIKNIRDGSATTV